jgi:hypothetical protein
MLSDKLPTEWRNRIRAMFLCPGVQFFEPTCIKQAGGEIEARILCDRYGEWCRTTGEKPLSTTAFGRKMSELKIERNTCGGLRRYSGLSLRDGAKLRVVG